MFYTITSLAQGSRIIHSEKDAVVNPPVYTVRGAFNHTTRPTRIQYHPLLITRYQVRFYANNYFEQ